MYVNMNGILAAQRPGRTAGRAPGRRPLLSSGAAEACALARLGVSLSRFLARASRSLRTPLRLPVRGCGVPMDPGVPGAPGCSVVGPGSEYGHGRSPGAQVHIAKAEHDSLHSDRIWTYLRGSL